MESSIKQKALELGFSACGVARAGKLTGHEARFDEWIGRAYHGEMAFLERNHDKRLDPTLLLPGAKSVIVVAQNYFPGRDSLGSILQHPTKSQATNTEISAGRKSQEAGQEKRSLKIAKYAWGKDYHYVIKAKLAVLTEWLEAAVPDVQSRAFVDSAPVLERAWATEAGIGWPGKNTCLIIPQKGSFFFLATVLTTLELSPDAAFTKNHCGNCSRCIDACPTGAIVAAGTIDARRCLSYQTIENKDPITQEIAEKNPGWLYGCDICQDVCPHNRFANPHNEPAFEPIRPVAEWGDEQWCSMSRGDYKKEIIKAPSAMTRARHKKMLANCRRLNTRR